MSSVFCNDSVYFCLNVYGISVHVCGKSLYVCLLEFSVGFLPRSLSTLFIFVCMSVLPACVCVWMTEGNIRVTGTGAAGSCESPCGCSSPFALFIRTGSYHIALAGLDCTM